MIIFTKMKKTGIFTNLLCLQLLFFMTLSLSAVSQAKISFNVSFSKPQAHYADVQMSVSDINTDFIDLKMPVWTPGSYLIREFSKNVEALEAFDAKGSRLPSHKISKNTWRIKNGKSTAVSVSYRVYAFEISVRTSFVDASHAFLSPAGIFMYVDGRLNEPAVVNLEPYKSWSKVSTGLDPVNGKTNTFYAADFDILFDSPIEIGNQDIFEFEAAGVKHEVAMYGGGNYDKERLTHDIKKIVEEQTAIFGENPNKRYVFIVHNYNQYGGGLEHLNSTVLGASRYAYSSESGYKGFLGLVSHEYFHLWNIKRLRPEALGPFNYDQENYTTNLWIAEGFTAYYDDLILRRCGIYSPEQYLDKIVYSINTVENKPGNKIQPLSEASFDAWIKYYRPNENSSNSTVSYYDKGSLIGMIMDLEIIHSTGGKKSLDDVLKALYDEFYKKKKRGFTDEEFKTMAERIAGKSLKNIYEKYINGTEPIRYNDYFGHAGLYLVNDKEGNNSPHLGASASSREGKFVITSVYRGGSAWNAGLNVNDEIIAIDNNRISSASDIERILNTKKAGETIGILISRDALLQTIEVQLQPDPTAQYRIEVEESPTQEQLLVRKKWLKL